MIKSFKNLGVLVSVMALMLSGCGNTGELSASTKQPTDTPTVSNTEESISLSQGETTMNGILTTNGGATIALSSL